MTVNPDFRTPAMSSRYPELPWLLPCLALTAAHIGSVLLGFAPPLSSVLLLAMAAAWLAFCWRVLGRPQPEILLGEEQKLMAELRDFVAREVEGTRAEIERTRALLGAAVAELTRAFAEMEGESRVQGVTITNLFEQIAEREMDPGVEARIRADALKEQAERVNRLLADGIRAVSGSGKRIHDSVGTAVRSLQFEDIAAQALTAANVHLERLQAINRDATRLQNVLTSASATPDSRMQVMEEFLRHIKEVRDHWVKPAHKPVAQVDLKSGSVELF